MIDPPQPELHRTAVPEAGLESSPYPLFRPQSVLDGLCMMSFEVQYSLNSRLSPCLFPIGAIREKKVMVDGDAAPSGRLG